MKVELDLFNYATKADLKNARGVGTAKFAKKIYLTNLKSNIDKLDVGKLENSPNDLSKLSNVVKNHVLKKTEYNAKIKNIEDKILDITNLATETALNAKANEVKRAIPSITDLATTASLNARINEVKGKIPNITY